MNGTLEDEHLPRSVGGLLGFALSAWAANARLYLALALGVIAAYTIAEFAITPAAASTPLGEFKVYVLQYTGLFADALVVAAVALGVATCATGTSAPSGAIAAGAVERWLPVIAVTFLAQAIVALTSLFSGLTQPPEPRALVFLTAPVVWILWGILSLAGPFVALGSTRSPLAVMVGFARAFTVSLRRGNLLRLCVLAVVMVLPSVFETLLQNALMQGHVDRAIYWANAPIDALTVGPLTAIATAFALDFVRRQRSA